MSPLEPNSSTIACPEKSNIDEAQDMSVKIAIKSMLKELKEVVNKSINKIYEEINK